MTTAPIKVAPWQVWWVNFSPQVGHEQANDRPAIVVGTDLACRIPNNLVIVVPCTTRDRQAPWQPSVVLAGVPTFVLCEQLKALDKSRFRKQHPALEITSAAERETIARVLRELVTVGV